MDTPARKTRVEASLLGLLQKSQRLSYYVESRGWGFVLTWAHRIAGLALAGFLLFHILTLSALYTPADFASKMKLVDNFVFAFLEWALAAPVIFHALNGTRLILYEAFRVREDAVMIRWVLMLGAIYLLALGIVMVKGDQYVSPGFFWPWVVIGSAVWSGVVYKRLWHTGNRTLWKLQRVTGALLLPLVSGHMFFMHLNFKMGHDADTILARVAAPGMKAIDLAFVLSAFFHAGFGLSTIVGDYVEDGRLRIGLRVLMTIVFGLFAYSGARLILSI